MGYSTVRRIMREGLTDPRNLDGIALWNSTRDVTDLTTDTGIKLWADKSGNSSTNVLCLNGVAGNYASAPDSVALSVTGSIMLEWFGSIVDWTPAAEITLVGKYGPTAGQKSYALNVGTSSQLKLYISADGAVDLIGTSTAFLPVADFDYLGVRATRDQATGTTRFYYSTNLGASWTKLGADTVVSAGSAIFDSTSLLYIGSSNGTSGVYAGNVSTVRILNGYDGAGSVVFDANFSTVAKLAPSFTESSSNAATVTINTSGATGARISGARDLYQGTAANQPILTIAAAGNYLTFDGSNDYLKAAAFALAQPETVYFVGSQVTHAGNDTLYDGNAADSMRLLQFASPYCTTFAGLTGVSGSGAGYALLTNQIYTAVFNGASSVNRVNRLTANTGQAGSNSANGFLLGAYSNGASGWANITAQEVLVYSTAQDENYQYRVTRLLSRRTGVLVA